MGLFSVFKKKQNLELPQDDLDLPPPPPAASEGEDLAMASISEEDQEMLDQPTPPTEDFPKFPDQIETQRFKEPKFVEQPLSVPEMYGIKKETAVIKERKTQFIRAAVPTEPLFVDLDSYRLVLEGIVEIKKALRVPEEAINKISKIKSEEDKIYDKFQKTLVDVQKKLLLVDKTLFKR